MLAGEWRGREFTEVAAVLSLLPLVCQAMPDAMSFVIKAKNILTLRWSSIVTTSSCGIARLLNAPEGVRDSLFSFQNQLVSREAYERNEVQVVFCEHKMESRVSEPCVWVLA